MSTDTCTTGYGPQCLSDQPSPWWTAPATPPDDSLADTGFDLGAPATVMAIVIILFGIWILIAVIHSRRAEARRTAIKTAAVEAAAKRTAWRVERDAALDAARDEGRRLGISETYLEEYAQSVVSFNYPARFYFGTGDLMELAGKEADRLNITREKRVDFVDAVVRLADAAGISVAEAARITVRATTFTPGVTE